MAVINCPSCSKKISSKATVCDHCQINLENIDEEKLANMKRIALINESQKMMTLSFIALLLFCGGFLFFYWQNAQIGTWEYVASVTSAIVGFILYIFTRVKLILLKRKNK